MKWNKPGDGSTCRWGQDLLIWKDNKPTLIKNNQQVEIHNGTTDTSHWLPIQKPYQGASSSNTSTNSGTNFLWLSKDNDINRANQGKYLLVYGYKGHMVKGTYDLFLTKWVRSIARDPNGAWGLIYKYHMEDQSITAEWYCIVEPPETEQAQLVYRGPVEKPKTEVSFPNRIMWNLDWAKLSSPKSKDKEESDDYVRLVLYKEPKVRIFPSIDFYHEVRRNGRKVTKYVDGSHGQVYYYQGIYYDTRECIVVEPSKLQVRLLEEQNRLPGGWHVQKV